MKKLSLILILLSVTSTTHAATVTTSIKASGGDYTTPTAWEADLDNGAVYSAGDDAVGELYNEEYSISSALAINGGGTVGLNSVKLSVASGNRHDGTAGTGARITTSTGLNAPINLVPIAGTDKLIVEWFELHGNDQNMTNKAFFSGNATAGRIPVVRNVLAHDFTTTAAAGGFAGASNRDIRILNSIFYNFVATLNNRSVIGFEIDGDNANGGFFNNTMYNLVAHGTGHATGTDLTSDNANARIRNNIMVGASGTTDASFGWPATQALLTSSNNLSDDATSDDGGGSGHITGATIANIFVSTVDGSEDLHLKTGSPAIDTGVDLVTTPSGVNLDIDGYDRDSTGVTWDIGADELVGVAVISRVIRLHGVRLYGIRLQ